MVPNADEKIGRQPWQPWVTLAVVALLLNLVWKLFQSPLYVARDAVESIRDRIVCRGVGRRCADRNARLRNSRGHRPESVVGNTAATVMPILVHIVLGIVVSVGLELVNVNVLARWSYTPAMPLIRGVALAALAQWLVVPSIGLVVARRWLRRIGAATVSPSSASGGGHRGPPEQ